MVSNRSRRCRCGCGETFVPDKYAPTQAYFSDACRQRADAVRKRAKRKTTDSAGQEIRRVWGECPVIDAKKDLRVFITPEDVAGAERGAPEACVFALACLRSFQATKVLFYRSIAYVQLPDSKGVERVERFCLDEEMRRLVEAFDKGEGVVPKGGFLLRAPRPGKTLDHKRKMNASVRSRAKLEGRVEGRVVGQGESKPGAQSLLLDLAVRNGTGAVHFTPKKDGEAPS